MVYFFRFSDKELVRISDVSGAYYVPHTSHRLLLCLITVITFFTRSCYFLALALNTLFSNIVHNLCFLQRCRNNYHVGLRTKEQLITYLLICHFLGFVEGFITCCEIR
jgi:hypothetical protein